MIWQRRLAEMVLAGGAIAAVGACSNASSGSNFCCNANGDPCCTYKYCGGPMTPECACEMEGGVPVSVYDAGKYSSVCQARDAEASD